MGLVYVAYLSNEYRFKIYEIASCSAIASYYTGLFGEDYGLLECITLIGVRCVGAGDVYYFIGSFFALTSGCIYKTPS